VQGRISWSSRFRARQYLKGSLWFGPLLGGVTGTIFATLDVQLDKAMTLPGSWQYTPSTASTLLATLVGAMVALTGFVITVSVLVVQMATGTFSARYMRLWYRDRMLKTLLAVLVGTLTFSFALLRRVEPSFVPNLGVTIAVGLVVAGLLMFLLFLDRFIHRLRPVAVAVLVSEQGRRAFRESTAIADGRDGGPPSNAPAGRPAHVVPTLKAGAIQALDTKGLVEWARAERCLLVFPHAVGDFLPSGAALIEVFGRELDEGEADRLRGMVALGIERTFEQDPAFAIRILVDIAIRALSPAVNDPTTAVQVLNHLGDTLAFIGRSEKPLYSDHRDEHGLVRLLVPARSWEDYLSLGVTEIREYGGSAIQVTRRLRALLDELLVTVRPDFRAAVEQELERLDATVARNFGESVDLDRAGTADRQGIGGPPAELQMPSRTDVTLAR
jgi:uncharacterized membrane protein